MVIRVGALKPESALSVLQDYATIDREIKTLEAQRAGLKPAVQAALAVFGGSHVVDGQRLTWSTPEKMEVDMVALKRFTSPKFFWKLVNVSPYPEAIRAAIKLGRMNADALGTITFVPDTPRVVVTQAHL